MDVVLHGDFQDSYLLAHHLVEHGRRKIVFIGGPLGQASGVLRLSGYQEALEEAGIEYDKGMVRLGDWQAWGSYKLALKVVAISFFAAIFSANFDIALGALKAFQKFGVLVPDQIALVAFDDLGLAELANPPLTTLKCVKRGVDIIAAWLLLNRVNNPNCL